MFNKTINRLYSKSFSLTKKEFRLIFSFRIYTLIKILTDILDS